MTSDPKFTRAAVTTFHADDHSGSDNSNDNGDWSTGSDVLNKDERLMMRHSIRCSFLNKTISSSHKPTQPPTPPLCHLLLYEVVMMLLVLLIVLSLKATRLLLLQFLPSQRSSSQSKKHGHVKPTSTDFN